MDLLNKCSYCNNIHENHSDCENIYLEFKEYIKNGFDRPYKIFIENRRKQTENIHSEYTYYTIILIIITALGQIYKTLASVFIIIFIPYNCANEECSYISLYLNRSYNTIALSIGCVTFLLFIILYIYELKREQFLISNLIFNTKDNTGIP